jgi:hypothetical protein
MMIDHEPGAIRTAIETLRWHFPGRKLKPFPKDKALAVCMPFEAFIVSPQPGFTCCLCDWCLAPIVSDEAVMSRLSEHANKRGLPTERICFECYAFTDSQFAKLAVVEGGAS